MRELEKKIVKPMIESEKLKFYMRYVDDTLILAEEDDMNYIFGKFNSFHKNVKFTMDCFDDYNIYFLDIAIDKIDADLYYKATHTRQYSSFNSSLPRNYKISWHSITLVERKFKSQIDKIKLFMPWNVYPSYTRKTSLPHSKSQMLLNA